MRQLTSSLLFRCTLVCILLVVVQLGCQQAEVGPGPSIQNENGKSESRKKQGSDDSAAGKLIWADEFEGEKLDLTKWKFETGASGWGNNELQDYTAGDNVRVSDGTLKIIARKSNDKEADFTAGDFTSTRLNSVKQVRYGRVEVRAKIPELKGNGIWPAIWMLGGDIKETGWPMCGEIDMMEYVSASPDEVQFTIHCQARNHGQGTQAGSGPIQLPSIEEEFHVYGMNWTPEKIEFYLDEPSNIQFVYERPENFNKENWPFDKPYYLLLNIAVGGSWGGMKGIDPAAFPATMEIDFVRVYTNNP